MKLISKVQIQILLINIIILCLFIFDKANSKIKNCNSFSPENIQLEDNNYPLSIEIIISNSKKWTTRLLKSMGGNRINKRYKKYQKAKIITTYPNKLVCEHWGKVRIHGSTISHINLDNFNTSLRVQIEDGHVNNKHNFALLNKKSTHFGEEIFVSSLFEELGYLSPLTYVTKVKINNNQIEDYLFYEMPSLEMSKDKKRNNGIFLASNKNNFADPKVLKKYQRSIILNRIKNSDGISGNNEIVKLNALEKLNYIYINSLGIGNGKDCCSSNATVENLNNIKNNYNNGNYSLNFSVLDYPKEIEFISIFNILMNATNSQHGLALEDRFFFYDPMFDRFEPVYRDGDPKIVRKNDFNLNRISLFNYEKKFINSAIDKINLINVVDFNKVLNERKLKIDITETKKIFNNILANLEKIKTLDLFKNYESKFANNYFFNHYDQNIKLNLAFGGQENKFEICSIDLVECKIVTLNLDQKDQLLNDKFLNLNRFNKPIYYVRLSKKNYLQNLKPKDKGLKLFKKIKINSDQTLFYNTFDKNIKIDKINKIIILKQENRSDKFVFTVKNFNDWKIKFSGSEDYLKKYPLYKRDENMIGGCVAFVNSEIINVSIQIKQNTCSKGLEVLNTVGSFKKITINNSKLDAFDSEFSNLYIEEINIDGALSGECIGVKRGKYFIKNAKVNDCGDHSVSVGEHAELILDKITAFNAKRIMSKDSSSIEIFDFNNLNSDECLVILRKKKHFNGASIKVKKNKLKCVKQKIEKDEFSTFSFF